MGLHAVQLFYHLGGKRGGLMLQGFLCYLAQTFLEPFCAGLFPLTVDHSFKQFRVPDLPEVVQSVLVLEVVPARSRISNAAR